MGYNGRIVVWKVYVEFVLGEYRLGWGYMEHCAVLGTIARCRDIATVGFACLGNGWLNSSV